MTEDLPISLCTQGLFEPDDKASGFLIRKLAAWLNFQALVSHWYEDASKVVSFDLTLLPDEQFYRQDVEADWQTVTQDGLVAVFQFSDTSEHFKAYILLSNNEIDDFMKDGQVVEPSLRQKLARTLNHLAPMAGLPPLVT